MLKYLGADVTFSEIPDEVTLCIWVSGCPNKCEGCCSPELRENIGTILCYDSIKKLVEANNGVTCICFMGGDQEPGYINLMALYVKKYWPHLLIAWYSGNDTLSKDIDISNFNFIKIGHYDKDKGPLTSRTTNQRMYEVQMSREEDNAGNVVYGLVDMTYKFWKDDKGNS